MKRLWLVVGILTGFTCSLFGQSSAYSPQYFKRVNGVISPIVATDTVEVDITGDITGNLTGNVTGNVSGNLTGDVTGNVSGNAGTVTNGAYINVANIFTQTQTITNAAPTLALTDTTASAKSLTIAVDANVANIRESAGSAGSLLVLDLANNRVGIGVAAPSQQLHIASTAPYVFIEDTNGADLSFSTDAGNVYIDSTQAIQFRRNTTNTLNIDTSGRLIFTGVAFAALGTPANGTIVYCTDCQAVAVCADTGTGAFAKRLAGAWVCN